MVLDKAGFLAATQVKTEDVEIAGGIVRVSALGGTAFLEIYTNPKYKTNDEIDMVKFTPALLACTILLEDGSRMFTDDEAEEVGRRDKDAFLKLANAAKRLNGLTGEEIKNSEAGQTSDSSTDSACTLDSVTPTNSQKASQPRKLGVGKHTIQLNPSENTEAN